MFESVARRAGPLRPLTAALARRPGKAELAACRMPQ